MLAAFLPLKSCHSLHWVNFHGDMSKKIQSLNMGCDECRIIVSGSSIIGADVGNDGQARSVSWGAQVNTSSGCLESLPAKAAWGAALSPKQPRSIPDPHLLSMRDQARSILPCQCG